MQWNSNMDEAPSGELVLVTDGEMITAPGIKTTNGRWYFWEGSITDNEDEEYVGELNYWLDGFGPLKWAHLPTPTDAD